jgi:alkylation response protein AidB-like acyl-CoA dehydrogenase
MNGLSIEEREMVLDVIRKLRKRLLSQEKILELDETESFPEEIIRSLLGPDIGLQYVFIPEEFGGMGGGARDIAAVSEELARICLGVSTAFLAIHLGADPIILGGTTEQKAKWLGKIADEGSVVAYAVTEPEAGSNLSNLKTHAVPKKDDSGNLTEWEISGTKQFITNGRFADFMTVLAETPDGPSFFIVETNSPGFKPGKAESKHGIRCSNTNPLVFDSVKVPAENLVGGMPGQGLKQANAVFGYTRLMVAAFGLGAGVEALERATAYARERIQFGESLINKTGYTHKLLIPGYVRMEAARAYIEQSAENIDRGQTDNEVEGSIAKYFATEAGNMTAELAIQAFGGYGYMKEYEVEKIKRDVRITTIYEGTSEIQQMIIGTYRWRTTIRKKGAFYKKLADELSAIHDSISNIGADTVSDAAKILNILIMELHNVRLTRHQHILFSLADLVTLVEVYAALIKKTANYKNVESKAYKRLVLSSRILAADLAVRIQSEAQSLLLGTDSIDQDKAMKILASLPIKPLKAKQNIITCMDELATLL